jgi:hypothetical protein
LDARQTGRQCPKNNHKTHLAESCSFADHQQDPSFASLVGIIKARLGNVKGFGSDVIDIAGRLAIIALGAYNTGALIEAVYVELLVQVNPRQ